MMVWKLMRVDPEGLPWEGHISHRWDGWEESGDLKDSNLSN